MVRPGGPSTLCGEGVDGGPSAAMTVPGSGRPTLTEADPALMESPLRVLKPATTGDAMRPLLWVSKGQAKLAAALSAMKHKIKRSSIPKVLGVLQYRREVNHKTMDVRSSPDRDTQFEHINAAVIAPQAAGQPAIAIDTKKKELIDRGRRASKEGTIPRRAPSEQYPSFQLAFAGLIEKTKILRNVEFLQLEKVVDQSDNRLRPLGEPMKQDFGLHRWLAGAREEAYSDWFQWLFAQMSGKDLANVLSLPKLVEDLDSDILSEQVRVDREVLVLHGHEGRLGRIDILLRLGDHAVVVLEVKLGSAFESDTAKQEGYFRSIEYSFAGEKRYYVLLVTEEEKPTAEYDGKLHKFDVRTYPSICRNLRHIVGKKWMGDQTLFVGALVLMVAAAIETNLLRMSLQKNSFTPATLAHLRKFLERTDYE
jgi:hypothetical protein